MNDDAAVDRERTSQRRDNQQLAGDLSLIVNWLSEVRYISWHGKACAGEVATPSWESSIWKKVSSAKASTKENFIKEAGHVSCIYKVNNKYNKIALEYRTLYRRCFK